MTICLFRVKIFLGGPALRGRSCYLEDRASASGARRDPASIKPKQGALCFAANSFLALPSAYGAAEAGCYGLLEILRKYAMADATHLYRQYES